MSEHMVCPNCALVFDHYYTDAATQKQVEEQNNFSFTCNLPKNDVHERVIGKNLISRMERSERYVNVEYTEVAKQLVHYVEHAYKSAVFEHYNVKIPIGLDEQSQISAIKGILHRVKKAYCFSLTCTQRRNPTSISIFCPGTLAPRLR